MKNTANRAYAAHPDRLYIVGSDGKVAYHGGRGPFNFNPAEAKRALAKILAAKAPEIKTPKKVARLY